MDRGAWAHVGGSLVGHLALLAIAARLVSPLGATLDEPMLEDAIHLRSAFAIATASVDPDEDEAPATTAATREPDGHEPVESRCGEVRGGTMGLPRAAPASLRYGVIGPVDNPDPHLAWNATPWSVWTEPSSIGLTEASWAGDARAPVVVWGRDDALGTDAESARGHLFGEAITDALGSPGVGVGRAVPCASCGASGHGVARRGTAPDGAVGTERSGWQYEGGREKRAPRALAEGE